MDNEEELCIKFLDNPKINPKTGKRLMFEKGPYNYYVELCQKYGYSLPIISPTIPKPIISSTIPKSITSSTIPKPITFPTIPKPITSSIIPKHIIPSTIPKPITSSTISMTNIMAKTKALDDPIQELYEAENDLLEKLESTNNENDFTKYKTLVDDNINLVLSLDRYIWLDIFSTDDNYKEILFWINYPNRQLTVHELILIPYEFNDLFLMGINKLDLSLIGISGEVDALDETLGDLEELEEGSKAREILIDRIIKILQHKNFPENERGYFEEILGKYLE